MAHFIPRHAAFLLALACLLFRANHSTSAAFLSNTTSRLGTNGRKTDDPEDIGMLMTFVESTDAGNTPATAVILPAGTNVIQGTVTTTTDVADLYQFTLTQAGQYQIFSNFIQGDSTLMLFNCAGNGLAGNDDSDPGSTVDSEIIINLETGAYYFSVSEFPGVDAFE
jgi:Bacterial pre-peptidase C-terminal domain